MRLEDLDELKEISKRLVKEKRTMDRLCSASGRTDLTPKQVEKANADANWQGMELSKLEHEAHAIAVNCGIADRLAPECYESVEFHPSPFHTFTYQPRKPRSLIP